MVADDPPRDQRGRLWGAGFEEADREVGQHGLLAQPGESAMANSAPLVVASDPPRNHVGRLWGAGYEQVDSEVGQGGLQRSAGKSTRVSRSDEGPIGRLRERQRQETADQAEARALNAR